jgi:hypothetical protein
VDAAPRERSGCGMARPPEPDHEGAPWQP